MASLTGQSIASSYKDLLQVSNSNSGIDTTARIVSDGEGTDSNLYLSTTRVGIGMSPNSSTGGMLDIQATDHLKLRFYNSTNFKAGLEVATSSGDMITGSATNDFCIRSQSNMLFAAGGATESVRIDAAGKLGVGGSPIAQLTLTDATSPSFALYESDEGTHDKLWLQSCF